jgi:lincosamide nucleotidyltransferase A/C/D/E
MVAMDAVAVIRVLDALAEAGVSAGVAGGWGVDALLGRQTREHEDLDLGIPLDTLDLAISRLAELGYRPEVDELPGRLGLAGPEGAVDLHPIDWRDETGVQTTRDGTVFRYPPGSLDAAGVIDGRAVRCATPELQLEFHRGYPPRPRDRADMGLLAAEFGLQLPRVFRDPPAET